jgi:hypothetical protein
VPSVREGNSFSSLQQSSAIETGERLTAGRREGNSLLTNADIGGQNEATQSTAGIPVLVDLGEPIEATEAQGANLATDQTEAGPSVSNSGSGHLSVAVRGSANHGAESLSGPDIGQSREAFGGTVKSGHKRPRVAKKLANPSTADGEPAAVVSLDAERDKRLKTQQDSLATCGQKTLRKNQPRVAKSKPYVEAVGASVGTMAFRLRWRENGIRQPPIYMSRVSIEVYEMIKGGDYEAFKRQLVSSHSASSVRASHTA